MVAVKWKGAGPISRVGAKIISVHPETPDGKLIVHPQWIVPVCNIVASVWMIILVLHERSMAVFNSGLRKEWLWNKKKKISMRDTMPPMLLN